MKNKNMKKAGIIIGERVEDIRRTPLYSQDDERLERRIKREVSFLENLESVKLAGVNVEKTLRRSLGLVK